MSQPGNTSVTTRILITVLPVATIFAVPSAMASLDLDVTDYRLRLSIGFENQGLYKSGNELEDQSRISLANRSDQTLDRIPFLLNRVMKAVGVRDGAGRKLAFSQLLTALDDWDLCQAQSDRSQIGRTRRVRCRVRG